MAIDCFTGYIGLSNCVQGVYTQPASGTYINALPGISLENIEKTADAEQVSYIGVWNDVQAFALAQFRMDVLNEMKKCWQLNKDCDYDALICDNIEELATAWKYLLGVTLMVFRLTSDRINRWTTIGRDEAKELQAFYQAKYDEALQQGVLLMDTDECCLTCEPNPSMVTYLP
jgi:hypothetical protein